MEENITVTFKNRPVTLIGPGLKAGDIAPDFNVTDNNLQPFKFSGLKGEIVIISSVPSIDTSVCELQTIRFNEEASKLNAAVLTISMDLHFAQKRFCDSFTIKDTTLLSDYKDRDFSKKFGLYIKELGLIARAVFVIDKDGKISYREIVDDISHHPDYDRAIEEAKKAGA